jgi:RHS repeat-associated protein
MTSDGTNTYAWDAENRLIQITYPGSGNNSQFTFDYAGKNTKIVENSGGSPTSTRQFIWCGISRCESRDNSSTLISSFFSAGQVDSSVKRYYTKDHVGSIRELADNTGSLLTQYQYDLFGNQFKISGSVNSDFQFANYFYHSQSGLYLTYTRAYKSSLGRFINRDLIEENGGMNLYSYTKNPVNFIDPSGKDSYPSLLAYSKATGYPASYPAGASSFTGGCFQLVSSALELDLPFTPEGQSAMNYPRPNEPDTAHSTRCWYGTGGNPAKAIKEAKCHNCPAPTYRTVYWCKQGKELTPLPDDFGGKPMVGNPQGAIPGGDWNYSVWDPTNGYSDVARGGVLPRHTMDWPPGGPKDRYNRSYCCATCVPTIGK